LMTYGYRDSVLFPVTAWIDSANGDTLRIKAFAQWQVCKQICLLEKQEVEIRLPVSGTSAPDKFRPNANIISRPAPRDPDPAQRERFDHAWKTVPSSSASGSIRVAIGDSVVVATFAGFAPPKSARIFPIAPGLLDDAAPQRMDTLPNGFRLTLVRDPFLRSSRPDSFAFVLTTSSDLLRNDTGDHQADLGRALETKSVFASLQASDTAAPPAAPKDSGYASSTRRYLIALLSALLGGLLLNLMPCVLPVLSLKVLDILRQAGQDRHTAIAHGIAYAAGVVGSFLALAALLLVLRASGSALGWGFQMQSPPVVAILSALMLLVACNLWGLFEPGAGLANLGSHSSSGLVGSLLTGLTATVVATPCTAPFMGAALGYTLTRPAFETLSIFAFLGLGLAAPVMLITALPTLGRALPRPGAWMETLKQALGFAMAATAAWLGWLLARLSGTDALLPLFSIWIAVGMAAWILGRWAVPHHRAMVRWMARAASVLLLLAALMVALHTRMAVKSNLESGPEELWHAGLTEELRASGKPWFLHFTADWCLSCQVNERNAFQDSRVEAAFEAKHIRRVKADWTARDSSIARELERFHRQGIPFYILSDGKTESVLPEVVTPGIVLSALDRIP